MPSESGGLTPATPYDLNDSLSSSLAKDLRAVTLTADGDYKLHAVLVHKGTATSGHYFAIIRDSGSSDAWFEFNDESAKELSSADVARYFGSGDERGFLANGGAYMVVYQRAGSNCRDEGGQPDPSPDDIAAVSKDNDLLEKCKRAQRLKEHLVSVRVWWYPYPSQTACMPTPP